MILLLLSHLSPNVSYWCYTNNTFTFHISIFHHLSGINVMDSKTCKRIVFSYKYLSNVARCDRIGKTDVREVCRWSESSTLPSRIMDFQILRGHRFFYLLLILLVNFLFGSMQLTAPPSPPPHCTKCNSPPINGQCTSHCIAIWWSVALRFKFGD